MKLRRRREEPEPVVPAPPPKSALERAADDLSASDTAATRVLHVLDLPLSGASDIARNIELDPVFTADVLRVANSAAFGAMSTVATTARAVAVIGLSTVRSIAARHAAASMGAAVPGFLRHSAATAAGCVAASSAFGVSREEAFSVGLLHDIGWALLDLAEPAAHRAMVEQTPDGPERCVLEFHHFGMPHDTASGWLLGRWGFPATITDAIHEHHRPLAPDEVRSPHAQLVAIGDALADLADHAGVAELADAAGTTDAADVTGGAEAPAPPPSPSRDLLGASGFGPAAIDHLVELTRELAAETFGPSLQPVSR